MFKNLFKKEPEYIEIDDIERQARRLGSELGEVIGKYDERTEEIIELLREKSEGLWECRIYYDKAIELKNENKALKTEKNEEQQKSNAIKKQWNEIGQYFIDRNLCIKPQSIKFYNDLVMYLKFIQYVDKDDIPVRNIVAAIKRLKVTREELEKDCGEAYNNLKIKDWEF